MKLWFEKGLASLVTVASLTVGASSFAAGTKGPWYQFLPYKKGGRPVILLDLLDPILGASSTSTAIGGLVLTGFLVKSAAGLERASLPYIVEELRNDIEIYRATEELTVPLQAYLDHMRDEEAVSQEVSDLELIEFLDGEIQQFEQKL